MEKEKTPISSLSAYVKYLEDHNFLSSNYIFRGEHCHVGENGEIDSYEKRMSGAFRIPVKPDHIHGKNVYPLFTNKIKEYYSQIGHRLSDVDREQFVAFSQHYGLTTNLLDVTASPLVALFFACYEESCCKYKKPNKNGKVYIFDNDSIDITLVLSEFQKRGVFNQDVFDKLSTGDIAIYNTMNTMHDALKKYIEENFFIIKKEYTENGTSWEPDEPKPMANERICRLYNCALQIYNFRRTNTQALGSDLMSNNPGSRSSLQEVRSCAFEDLKKSSVNTKHEFFRELYNGIMQDEPMSDFKDSCLGKFSAWWTNIYLLFLIYVLRTGDNFGENQEKQLFCDTCMEKEQCGNMPNFLPTLVYKPQITFDRARLQKGHFIYQPYREVDKNEIRPFQYNAPIVEIDIQNTDEILQRLDMIDINLGTIFGDYDNIAKYIANKI